MNGRRFMRISIKSQLSALAAGALMFGLAGAAPSARAAEFVDRTAITADQSPLEMQRRGGVRAGPRLGGGPRGGFRGGRGGGGGGGAAAAIGLGAAALIIGGAAAAAASQNSGRPIASAGSSASGSTAPMARSVAASASATDRVIARWI
ncbi:MAG: hypothetical protein QM722_00455 [Piscinibacter sp.]